MRFPKTEKILRNLFVAASGEEEVPEAILPGGQAADPEPEGKDQDQRRPHALRCPREPTAAGKAAHEFTHWPPRPWCAYCVFGRSIRSPHWAGEGDEGRDYPIISMDYAYFGASAADEQKMWEGIKRRVDAEEPAGEDGIPEHNVPVLVLHDSRSSGIYVV